MNNNVGDADKIKAHRKELEDALKKKIINERTPINKLVIPFSQNIIDKAYEKVQEDLESIRKTGKGYYDSVRENDGLFDDQINTIMSRFHDFKGTIMRDQIKKILPL